ncbi:hypothetical protein QYE76_050799 [Lolium multiflorum]|uniref:Uncharacterized protein n=1 Tax=Lolium multiflorum TaxID=4521 RepID=A0AAD8SS19_LOLMU|nr:hypothetical protein QYE76_050799 [Lolium multiflorum]
MLEQYGTPDGRTRRPSLSLRGLGSIFVGGRWYVVIRVPKSLRAKRELLKHAPKIVEKGKKMLILYGTKTSAVLNSVLADLFHPKRDHAVKYTKKKDSIMRFERGGETSPEFFSLESECSLLISEFISIHLRPI